MCPVYIRLRVNTLRALDTAKNRRITSCCIKSCHGLCQHQIVVDSLPLTSKLSFTNAEPSSLKQSSLPCRASQNALQQLITSKGHAGCKKESNLPRREVTELWKLRSRVIIASKATATSREQTDHALKLATKTNVKRENLETVQKRKSLGGAIQATFSTLIVKCVSKFNRELS